MEKQTNINSEVILKLQNGGLPRVKELRDNVITNTVRSLNSPLGSQQNVDHLKYLGYMDKIKARKVEQARQLEMASRGANDWSDAAGKAATNLMVMGTQFRLPNDEEYRQSTGNFADKVNLVAGGVAHGLVNDMTAGAASWLGEKITSGAVKNLISKAKISNYSTPKLVDANSPTIYNLDDLVEYESGLMAKKPSIVKQALDAKVLPLGKFKMAPDRLRFESNENNFGWGVKALDDTGKSWGHIEIAPNGRTTAIPSMIAVDPTLRGLKMQDILYQKAIDAGDQRGMSIISGKNLLSPSSTAKAHTRFNRDILYPEITDGVYHDVVTLKGHKNPNVVQDWLMSYNNMNKNLGREKISVNDLYKKIIPGKPKIQQGLPNNGLERQF